MGGIFENDHQWNQYTHFFYPARTLTKELIYWPCEIAAFLLFFIYVLQSEFYVGVIYSDPQKVMTAYSYKVNSTMPKQLLFTQGVAVIAAGDLANQTVPLGFFYPDGLVQGYSFERRDFDLMNREYAWIAVIYLIKHLLYTVETFMLMSSAKKKKCSAQVSGLDLIGHIFNMILYLFWALYGFLNEGLNIFAGIYLKWMLDGADEIKGEDATDEQWEFLQKSRRENIELYKEAYKRTVGWKWLYIPTVILFVIILALFALHLIKKRSSAYHGLALSSVLIPLQLFFYSLFLKGNWISSNRILTIGETRSRVTANNRLDFEFFDARWVFPVPFIASFFALFGGILCLAKGLLSFKTCVLTGVKYVCYTVFFVALFLWVFILDNTLFHIYNRYYYALIYTMVVGFVAAIIIAVISIVEKKKEGNAFFERHNRYADWGKDAYYQQNPHWSKNGNGNMNQTSYPVSTGANHGISGSYK